MRLSQLLQDLCTVPATVDCDVNRLSLDSRTIQKNDVFLAISGTHSDGRQFIDEAIAKGAAAVLYEADDCAPLSSSSRLIPIYKLRHHLGDIAARFYAYPAKKMRILGVTGTNGKTSCSHFIAQMMALHEKRCAIIGTLGSGFYGELKDNGLTTPDALVLQALLASFSKQQAEAIAMEVSSHSIHQGRVNAIPFEFGIFTNLTQDHLDYHGSMEAYAEVKKSFLRTDQTKTLIINADDHYGSRWASELQSQKPVHVYGYKNLHISELTSARNIKLSMSGIRATITSPWGSGELATPLIGEFNLSNVLATITALCAYGIPFDSVMQHLTQLKSVAGRMQTLGGKGMAPTVVIDYAHTPDALDKALAALRAQSAHHLICVFGCGGDRDKSKRPLMAQIVEQYADAIIVTNDNPRHEDPFDIAQDILCGFAHPERVMVELDRAKAIQKSIQLAKSEDCILLAGKGAEAYQQIGDVKLPFNDAKAAQTFLNNLEKLVER